MYTQVQRRGREGVGADLMSLNKHFMMGKPELTLKPTQLLALIPIK
jgi:hypothetical protein